MRNDVFYTYRSKFVVICSDLRAELVHCSQLLYCLACSTCINSSVIHICLTSLL